MTTNRLKHIIGILGALALALVPVWGAVDVPLAGKIAVSITVAISVVFSLQKRAEVVNLLLGAIGIIGPIITIWLARVPQGTSAAIIGGTVLAVISNLRTALGKQAAVADAGDVPGKVVPIIEQPDTTPRDPAKGGTVLSLLVVVLGIAATGACIVAALMATGCKTVAPAPDTFAGRVVTCAEGNGENPAASSAVLGCLVGGTYAACLAGLPAAGHWSVDEIACLVRSYATPAAHAMLAAQPTANPARKNAAAWLREQRIAFRP